MWCPQTADKPLAQAGGFVHWGHSQISKQAALEMVKLEGLVLKLHLLRRIDVVVNSTSVHDLVAPHYCADNGRSDLDPTLLFKALFGVTCLACARNVD
jgi:hypothetical protein